MNLRSRLDTIIFNISEAWLCSTSRRQRRRTIDCLFLRTLSSTKNTLSGILTMHHKDTLKQFVFVKTHHHHSEQSRIWLPVGYQREENLSRKYQGWCWLPVLLRRQVDDFFIATPHPKIAHYIYTRIGQKIQLPGKIGPPFVDKGLVNSFDGINIHQTRSFIKLSC